jgi:subtilisin-like proprotein convertase family protein
MTFQWEDNANAESYYMEISDSPSFDNIVASGTDTDLDLVVEGLENNKVYYWRAQPINRCGTGDFSETYSFQTVIAEDCSATYTATDFSNAGIALSAGAQASVPVEVPDNLTISRLIVDVDITHQAVSHLTLFVQQPSGLGGARTTLLDQACDDADDFDVVFDDEGGTLVCSPDSPAVAGTIAPVESLRGSAGLNANGTWLFGVTDNVPTRGGIIDAASITVCSPVSNTNVPGFTNNSVAVVANDTYVFQTSDIEATTASETADQQVYTIVTTPEFGDILKSGTPLAVGGTFTQEDIDLGNISFSNIQTAVFTDSFKVDIVNGAGGWLPNQEINLTANTVSAESFELSNLMVYPNPTEGMIFVKFPTLEASNVKIDLFDLRGRRIFSEDFSVDQNLFKESISVGGISNGVYLIKVSNGNYSTTKRIIVQK